MRDEEGRSSLVVDTPTALLKSGCEPVRERVDHVQFSASPRPHLSKLLTRLMNERSASLPEGVTLDELCPSEPYSTPTLILVDADSVGDTELNAMLDALGSLSSEVEVHVARNRPFSPALTRSARCVTVPRTPNAADYFLSDIGLNALERGRLGQLITLTHDLDFIPLMTAWRRRGRPAFISPLRPDAAAISVAQSYKNEGVPTLPASFWRSI